MSNVAPVSCQVTPVTNASIAPLLVLRAEVETLLGDATKAREKLGWTPKITFQELVSEMMREDMKSAQRDELVKKHGFDAYNFHE